MRGPAPVLLACGLWAASTLLAQEEPGARYGETLDVRVVNVDVTVTDAEGIPVRGLDRGDFAIFEDGLRQEVTNFYAVEGVQLRSDQNAEWQAIAPDSTFRRRVLLLLDNNFIETPERDRAIAALESHLDQRFDGSYEWGVVAAGDEVRVLEPFTSDKLRVRAALDRAKSLPTFGARYRIERNFLNDPMRVRRAQRTEAAVRGGVPGAAGSNDNDFNRALRFESKTNVASTLGAFERTAGAMIQSFRAFADLPGNKVLVWITGGVPMLPEYGFQGEGTAGRGALSDKDSDLRLYQTELRKLVDAVAFEANAAQFKVYPVRATGLVPAVAQNDPGFRSSGATISETAFSSAVEVDDADSAQLSLALGTGGLYLTSNRTREAFETVDRDTGTYYSLGYRPSRAEDGAAHALRVEVGKAGLVARARSVYVDLAPETKLESMLATPLPFRRQHGSLPVRIQVDKRSRAEIVATISVPNSELTFVPEGEDLVGRIRIYLTIHDQAGNLVDLIREEQDLRFPAERLSDALAGELRYGLKFRLDKRGEYGVSVTLVDRATDELGTAFEMLRY